MMFKTHLAFGFIVGMLLIAALNPQNQILFMILILLGSALPDIDHPDSKIGSKVKFISFIFEHRGFFHGFIALAALAIGLVYMNNGLHYNILYVSALPIGYFSHLVMDTFTKEGIMPLHPFSRMRIRGFISTGRILEYIIFVFFVLVGAWQLITF